MRARDQVYHIGCFSCERCKRILATGEYFGMRNTKIFCKADYEILLREEAESLKMSAGSGTKGRPRKRRSMAAFVEGVTPLVGEWDNKGGGGGRDTIKTLVGDWENKGGGEGLQYRH